MDLAKYHYEKSLFSFKCTVIELQGMDAKAFMQGQSTNDINLLKEGEFQLNTFLDIKGKIEVYFFYLNLETPKLIVPLFLHDKAIERLEKFIIMEDVTLAFNDEYISIKNTPSLKYSGNIFGQSLSLSFKKSEGHSEEQFYQYFNLFGFSKACINESITETVLIESATSFSKGCFLGQEIVSKIYNNRGASYYPVLLKGEKPLDEDIFIGPQKRGHLVAEFIFNSQRYCLVKIFRDFRVNGKEIIIKDEKYTVYTFPFVEPSNKLKAQTLYDKAVDFFVNQDKENEAIEILQMAIEFDPSFSDAYESLGVIYGRHEQYDKAVELMKKLVSIDESSVMAHTNLSLYYMKQGKIEEAEEEKSKATVKTFQKLGVEAQSKREIEQKLKQKEEDLMRRESMFKQVLEMDEEDTLANYGMGEILIEKGEYQKAVEHLEKVISFEPKYSVAYLALGKSYLKLENKLKAIEVFKKGVDIAAAKGDMMPANQMQSYLNELSS